LRRDLEIVLFDERGAGNGRLLPAGPLREPIDSTSTARRQWVLYNAAQPSTSLPGLCARRRLAGLLRLKDWWAGGAVAPQAVEALRGHSVLASAGLGQPQRFFQALEQELGLQVQGLPLADHDDHQQLPWPLDTTEVIVTEKDATKLDPKRLALERPGLQVWVAPLLFELPTNLVNEVLAELERLRPPRPS
jgi:tetraacyldisaccharide 4'-kinase